MKLICLHGSPGSPEDFAPLEQSLNALPETRDSLEVESIARAGYPALSNERKASGISRTSERVILGYSWGCISALVEAAQYPERVRGLVLVSPYLFPETKTSLAKKVVISLPVIGDAILTKAAPKIIEELLVKSSHPQGAPESYRKASRRYADPGALRRAVREKEILPQTIARLMKNISDLKIPVALVWGAEDRTSRKEKQIDPVENALMPALEEKIEQGGHALLWTHSDQLARAIARFVQQLERSERP